MTRLLVTNETLPPGPGVTAADTALFAASEPTLTDNGWVIEEESGFVALAERIGGRKHTDRAVVNSEVYK
jgi:hypothetical protein